MAVPLAEHILIVGDDGDLLEVLKYVLEDAGYRVSVAEGGGEALSIVAVGAVSLILVDIATTDTNGIEVAKRLSADPRGGAIRLAILSGLAEAAIRAQFTDYDCYIAKTEDSEALVAAIRNALDQAERNAMVVGRLRGLGVSEPVPSSGGSVSPSSPSARTSVDRR